MKCNVLIGQLAVVCVFYAFICATNANQIRDGNTDLSLVGNLSCNSKTNQRFQRSNFPTAEPLRCPPCEQIHCYKQKRKRLRCKGGWTLGICGCCRVCAKLENEQCGGEHNYLGKCDEGLVCESQEPKLIAFSLNGVTKTYKIESGICKKVATMSVPSHEICKPKCSPQYCLKYPRGICSSTDNAERLQHCQGICQHTSCRACKFVLNDQQCPYCKKDDFKCIREFGRCIRKKSCKPKEYPCGNRGFSPKYEGSFKCQVPEC